MKISTISISLLFVFAFSLVVGAQCVEPPSGMVNWWPGDGNAFDIIGGDHGTLNGDAGFGDGKVDQAFALDGDGDFVQVNDSDTAAFNFEGSFTIDAWIYLEAVPDQFAPVVSKWNDVGVDQRSYFLTVENIGGGPRLRFDVSGTGLFLGGNSSIIISEDFIPLNTWVHVAGVYDAETPTLRMYIDGDPAALAFSEISPTVTSAFENDEPLLIGAGDLGSDERDFFTGLVDEVELFDVALTGEQIGTIFGAGENGKTMPALLDIKPDGVPNSINLKSKGKVPVAILSSETFDASTVDIASVVFAGAHVNVKNNGTFHAALEDVNDDGLLDLVMHFNNQDLDLNASSTEATLTGTTLSGRCISGTDSVRIVHGR